MTPDPPEDAGRWSRAEVEELLYREAELLDTWQLDAWLALLTDDVEYEIPASNAPGADCRTTLALVYDDRARLESRVRQYQDDIVHAERPRSRVCRLVTNVRIVDARGDRAEVAANFMCHRAQGEQSDVFFGRLRYVLQRSGDGLRIARRRVELNHDTLRAQRILSVIL